MIYRPRNIPTIRAVKFCDENRKELFDLGVVKIHKGPQGVCSLDVPGVCNVCGKSIEEHGKYKGMYLVCPGYYIIYEGRSLVNIMEPEKFESMYRPMVEPCDVAAEIDDGKEEEREDT